MSKDEDMCRCGHPVVEDHFSIGDISFCWKTDCECPGIEIEP